MTIQATRRFMSRGIFRWNRGSQQQQQGSSFPYSSTLASSVWSDRHLRKCEEDPHRKQKREYTPLIPVVLVGVVVGGAWVAYRKSQGRPVAPDEALAAQKAYKDHEEKLQQQQQRQQKDKTK